MPGEDYPFTTRVDPKSPPQLPPPSVDGGRMLVEAPGSAPGSATPIPSSVYRHSRRTSASNIGTPRAGATVLRPPLCPFGAPRHRGARAAWLAQPVREKARAGRGEAGGDRAVAGAGRPDPAGDGAGAG